MKKTLLCLFVFLICSCDKFEESNIPFARVYLELDFRFQDKDIVGVFQHKSITKPRKAFESTGFAGVLVVCGLDPVNASTTYYAYDLCCPHESRQNIKIIPSDDGRATCPECKTIFDIGNGTGTPIKGVSQYPLRRYHVLPKPGGGSQEMIVVNK